MLLRHYLADGMCKTELARRFGVSRRTIYHWIETGQMDRDLDSEPICYKARPAVGRKLDRFRGIIQARLESYPLLSAQRLFEEVRDSGYTGEYTQVKEYVRQIRPTPPMEPVRRFETPPGLQGQVDFATFNLPWGRRYALVVVLGYSRLLWLRFYPRQTMQVLFSGLESAFQYFCGVPRELLFDQMRAVIVGDQRLTRGALMVNGEFLRFASHWGFRPRACRPYRAKTKGKVERPIRYIRENFFYGRSFINDADLNSQAGCWLEKTANVREHRTVNEQPRMRFERDERVHLQPLATMPYPRLLHTPTATKMSPHLRVEVERRSLKVYAEAAL